MVALDVRLHVLALAVRVRLVLQDGGFDGRDLHHAVHILLIVVRKTDRVDLPRLDTTLHGLIRVLVIGGSVMQ